MEQGAKPVTNIILKHKEKQDLNEFANVLEVIAKKLKENGQFTFMQGEEAIEINPANTVKVEYEYSTKGDKHSFEIEIDWFEGDDGPKSMGIK